MIIEQSTPIKEDIFHLGIKLILYNPAGNILILKKERSKEYADLPGGRMQIGETHEQTAAREIREETGILELHNMQYLGMSSSPSRIQLDDEQTVGLIFSFYKANVNQSEVHLSAEHTAFKWITPSDAALLLHQAYGAPFLNNL